MTTESSSLFDELDSICQRIAQIKWRDQDIALKREASNTLRKLSVDLEEPGDLIGRIIYQPMDNVLLRLALDLNLFEILTTTQGASIHTATLAKETNVDPTLLQRILRALNAMGAVEQVGRDLFKPTKFSKAFTTQKGVCGAKFSFEFATPAWNQLPAYLAKNKYRNPPDRQNAAVQLAFNTKAHFFEILQERPEILVAFASYMMLQRDERPNFTDFFLADRQLADGFHQSGEDAVMFVDVGGGRGHETLELRNKFPNLPGRMIVQDRPEIIRGIINKEGMEVMEHDFFKLQPVKGARAYYFSNILHDFPFNSCVEILRQTMAAMTPGYSKILINELVVPDENAGTFMTRSDITMMTLLSAMERSEAQWRKLLGSVGLKVTHIWTADLECERIIECVLD